MAPTRARRREVTWDAIAQRAYAISQSDSAGSPDENWLRAELELRQAPTPGRRRAATRSDAADRIETAA